MAEETGVVGIMNFELALGEIGGRVRAILTRQSLLQQELAQQSGQTTAPNARMDRFDQGMSRIERRLDLTAA